eukprot:gene30719-35748_t
MIPHFLTTAALALALLLGLGVPSVFAIKCKTVATDKFYACPDSVPGVKLIDCLLVKEWDMTESDNNGDADLVTSGGKTYPVGFTGFDGGGSDKTCGELVALWGSCGDVCKEADYYTEQFKASKMPDGITLVLKNDFSITTNNNECCDTDNCITGLGFILESSSPLGEPAAAAASYHGCYGSNTVFVTSA